MQSAYTITYQGQWLSLNAVYSTHRWLRAQVKNEWKARFQDLLVGAQVPALEAFRLHIRYNSRMDCDNLTGGSKILVDTMRGLGLVTDDSKQYYRGVTIEPDLGLKHNTYLITIIPEPRLRPKTLGHHDKGIN